MRRLMIISGGQTGVDRAALDFAIAHGLPHGGWCPKGRLAEDGVIPDRYLLTETPTASFAQRTEWNVRDSDATVIFSIAPRLTGGSRKTLQFALKHKRPHLHLSSERDAKTAAMKLSEFLARHKIRVLNLAGPRESEEPEAGDFVRQTLEAALAKAR